jgi:hypothetical protein
VLLLVEIIKSISILSAKTLSISTHSNMVLELVQMPIGFDAHGVMQYTTGFAEPVAAYPAKRKTQIVETLHVPGNSARLSRRDKVLLASNARTIAAMIVAPPK